MGPILIFDKSALQGLNVDEAVMLDFHYRSNITPIFFAETLADLEMEMKQGRTPEQIVGEIARKTPVAGGMPNVHHMDLCLHELLGQPVQMRRLPVISGGRPTRTSGGVGVVYDQAPEAEAFERWQRGRFFEVERDMARSWRSALARMDLQAAARSLREKVAKDQRPADLQAAHAMATRIIGAPGHNLLGLKAAREKLDVPDAVWADVEKRWKSLGYPSIVTFAPYTAHVLTVDMFFNLALSAGHISERPSNTVDIAYLYYLPFTMIFTSGDKLHQRAVPLFLRAGQAFVPADELKRDLQAIAEFYGALPQADLDKGMYRISDRLPNDERYLAIRLRKLINQGDEESAEPRAPRRERQASGGARPAKYDELLGRIKELEASMKGPNPGRFSRDELEDPDQVVIKRLVPVRRGRWRMLPTSVEKKIPTDQREQPIEVVDRQAKEPEPAV